MARNYAALPHEYLEEMDVLSDEEFGRLCRALLHYSMTGEEAQLEGAERVLLKRVYLQEQRFQKSYDEQSNSKREAGKKGAAKRWHKTADDSAAMADDSKYGYTETKTETKTETRVVEANASCAEPETVSTPPVISLPLNDGTAYAVSKEQCQEWAGLYPAVDVIQQLRGMCGWLDANPQKRKTRRGIQRFVNAWLTREQDRAGQAQRPADQQRTGSSNPFLNMLEEQK